LLTDTFFPCYLYNLLFRKKLVFEVFDKYSTALISQRFKKLWSVTNFFEELAAENSDVLIIAGGEKVLETFKKRPNRCGILLNCPIDYFMDNTKLKPLDNDNKFNLVYTGGIRRERGL